MNEKIKRITSGGIWEHLNVKVIEAKNGKSVIELPVEPNLKQVHGVLHGGMIATLLDMSMALAASTDLAENEFTTTHDLSVKYLRPMFGNTLRCEGEVLKKGKRVTVMNAYAYDEEGELIATCTGSFINLHSK